MFSCTIILCQYNPEWNKLARTLLSIIHQREVQVQIVIGDDGSLIDYFSEITRLCEENQFHDYTFSKNTVNRGTVYNYWNALKYAKYEYVAGISPGDYYYNDTTLSTVLQAMQEHSYEYLFGKVFAYRQGTNGLEIVKDSYPVHTKPYLRFMESGDCSELKKIIVLYRQNNPAPAFFWRKELLGKYLGHIIGKVIYTEDLIRILAFMDEVKMGFLNQYLAWYEVGNGISTSKSFEWNRKIQKDEDAFFKMIRLKYPHSKLIQRANLLQDLENLGGIRAKILKPIFFPDRFFYLLIHTVLLRERASGQDERFLCELYEEDVDSCR